MVRSEGLEHLNTAGELPYKGAMVEIEAVVRTLAHLPCEELVRRVTEEVLAFADGVPQSDDITMVSLRVLG